MSGARGSPLSLQRRSVRSVAARSARWLLVAGLASPLAFGLTGSPASASKLPTCPSTSTWPVKPVSAPVKAALTKYYSARHLTPISVRKNQMWVMTVALETTGVHWCTNAGGGKSGYVGVVPKNATAAVLVQVTHKAYPVTGSATTFATVVKVPAGWKVVSDDTGP